MDRTAQLAIKIATQADVSGMDKTATAAKRMSDDVAKSSQTAERAARDYGGAADDLASKASQATGGLGALASGMELVGAEKYATGLQSAALATDFFSGVGDIGNLVLESTVVVTARAKAAALAHTVATKAQAAATRTMTAVQWALNVATSANPIALIVIAVVALIAGLVLLYKRSDRFREIVQKVGKIGREAIGWVVDKVGDLYGWFRDKLPGAASRMKDLLVRYILLVTTPYRKLIGWSMDLAGWFREKVPAALRVLRDMAGNALDKAFGPLETAVGWARDLFGWIEDILDKIPDIDLPDVSGIPGLGKVTALPSGLLGKAGATPQAAAPSTVVNNTYNINGAVDPYGTYQQVAKLQGRGARIVGAPG